MGTNISTFVSDTVEELSSYKESFWKEINSFGTICGGEIEEEVAEADDNFFYHPELVSWNTYQRYNQQRSSIPKIMDGLKVVREFENPERIKYPPVMKEIEDYVKVGHMIGDSGKSQVYKLQILDEKTSTQKNTTTWRDFFIQTKIEQKCPNSKPPLMVLNLDSLKTRSKRSSISSSFVMKATSMDYRDTEHYKIILQKCKEKCFNGLRGDAFVLQNIPDWQNHHLCPVLGTWLRTDSQRIHMYQLLQNASGISLANAIYFERQKVQLNEYDEITIPRAISLKYLVCIKDAALALARLHEVGAYHDDVKPGNIMCVPGKVGTLIDLEFTDSNRVNRIWKGTIGYHAPEAVKQYFGEYTKLFHASGKEGDIFALGVTLWDLICSKSKDDRFIEIESDHWREHKRDWMVHAMFHPMTYEHVLREKLPDRSGLIENLIYHMVAWDPKDRPTALQVVNKLQHIIDTANKYFLKFM